MLYSNIHRLNHYSMFVPRSVLDLYHKQLLDPDDDLHGVGAGAGHRPHQPPDLRWSVHLARPGGWTPPLHGRVSLHLGHLQLSAAVPVQTWWVMCCPHYRVMTMCSVLHLCQLVVHSGSVYTVITLVPRIQALVDNIINMVNTETRRSRKGKGRNGVVWWDFKYKANKTA